MDRVPIIYLSINDEKLVENYWFYERLYKLLAVKCTVIEYNEIKSINHDLAVIVFMGPEKVWVEDLENESKKWRINKCLSFVHGYKFSDLCDIVSSIFGHISGFYENGKREASVIVFDLDETLIDYEYKAICNIAKVVARAHALFDYVVLWTHGSAEHATYALDKIKKKDKDVKFDFVISRGETTGNKGIGFVFNELNRRFGVGRLSFTCLVDDTIDNFNNDYTFFINPQKIQILDALDRVEHDLFTFNCVEYQ